MESLITDVVAFVVDIAKIAGALLLAAAVGRKFIYDPITWVNGVNSKFASISSDLVELKGLVGELVIMQMQNTEKTSKSESPRKLTDLGKSISEYLNAPALMQDIAHGLINETAGKEAYDIQEMCLNHVLLDYEPPPEVSVLIKRCAFEFGVHRIQVLDVLAIELRDYLLNLFENGKVTASPLSERPGAAAG